MFILPMSEKPKYLDGHMSTISNAKNQTHKIYHGNMFVIIPGVNLETLLLFILATPIQVIVKIIKLFYI